MFQRHLYYSQTEVLKKYQISLKKYKEILPTLTQINNVVDMGTHTLTTIYVLRTDIERLGLKER